MIVINFIANLSHCPHLSAQLSHMSINFIDFKLDEYFDEKRYGKRGCLRYKRIYRFVVDNVDTCK